MNSKNIPELISFKVCPFVQRSAIILQEKQVEFKTTYVDLHDLPDWFSALSPLGKVPVLRVDDTLVFESAVIAEYLDECYQPSLHPQNLLAKASHRSWTEFASDITMNMFAMLYQESEETFNELKDKVAVQFSQVEREIDQTGPFFAGQHFSLVDASYAPIFLRLQLVDQMYPLNLFDSNGRLALWSHALLGRESVKTSVVDDFTHLFLSYMKNTGGYLSQQISS